MDINQQIETMKTELSNLSKLPPVRKYDEIHSVIRTIFPELEAARTKGHGFERISRGIELSGYRMPITTLKRHYRDEHDKRNKEARPNATTQKAEVLPIKTARAIDNECGFIPGQRYELANTKNDSVLTNLTFREFRDGKYYFDRLSSSGETYVRDVSVASMKYYRIIRK